MITTTHKVAAATIFCVLLGVGVYVVTADKFQSSAPAVTNESTIARTLRSTVEYDVPGRSHTIEFAVALNANDEIEQVTGRDITDPKHQKNVDEFSSELTTMIKGRKFSELTKVDKVGTSSLTTDAFNKSLALMKE